jgi:hypothetical protein
MLGLSLNQFPANDHFPRNGFWQAEVTTLTTANSLSSQTSKDLAQLAKKNGVEGWHSMRKAQLIRALLKIAKQKTREKSAAASGKKSARSQNKKLSADSAKTTSRVSSKTASGSRLTNSRGKSSTRRAAIPLQSDSVIAQKIRADREREENLKNLSLIATLDRNQQPPQSDRLVLVVRDAYWMQAYWEITKSTVQRAKVALDGSWHRARPVLRLMEITSDGNTNSVERLIQEIEIHGGVKNWYINVQQPGKSYRIAIGYALPEGRFHLICKSNQASSPSSSSGTIDENWTDITNDAEKYYAFSGGYDDKTVTGDLQSVFEEQARHPMHAPAFERLGSGINGHGVEFAFQVDAHLIVFGTTNPNGSVTIAGEPVRLQKDGTFSLKIDLPDRRQVLPVVAASRDGTQQRTTVLAIERNTKVMEAVTHEIESM